LARLSILLLLTGLLVSACERSDQDIFRSSCTFSKEAPLGREVNDTARCIGTSKLTINSAGFEGGTNAFIVGLLTPNERTKLLKALTSSSRIAGRNLPGSSEPHNIRLFVRFNGMRGPGVQELFINPKSIEEDFGPEMAEWIAKTFPIVEGRYREASRAQAGRNPVEGKRQEDKMLEVARERAKWITGPDGKPMLNPNH